MPVIVMYTQFHSTSDMNYIVCYGIVPEWTMHKTGLVMSRQASVPEPDANKPFCWGGVNILSKDPVDLMKDTDPDPHANLNATRRLID
jgi:hypothetical protein